MTAYFPGLVHTLPVL